MAKKRLIVIGGPTASGKTEAAIALARHYSTEIIGADARQVYAEMAIGVGRPSAEQLAAVPHHLIGHVSIHEHYTAGHYLRDVLPILDRLFEQHPAVILAGGTGLYIQAVLEGLDEIPFVPAELLTEWNNIAKTEGLVRLQEETARLDPAYYEVVDRQNPVRLIRAITVSLHTGRAYSSFRSGSKVQRDFDAVCLVMDLPRQELYARIDQRVLTMFSAGWLEEARGLLPYRHLKALQAVGYTELFDLLEGKRGDAETVRAIQQDTRRYAKRQITWWRHHGQPHYIQPANTAEMIRIIESSLPL